MVFENEKITILYGSQTGNAQDVAERIWRDSKCFYFRSSCMSMDAYNISELITEACVIFVCSTTGQGEEPDNMKKFWKFLLKRTLPLNSLVNVRCAVLGLGDSSYTKFNFTAKRLNKRLMQLGGQLFMPLGLGDDQHDLGYDAAVDPWLELLWTNLLNIYPLPPHIEPLERNRPIYPRWTISSSLLKIPNNVNKPHSIYYSTRHDKEFFVTVKENLRTTAPSHFQDVRLIKFQTNGEIYNPGDVLVLRPKNLPTQVQAFKDVLVSNGINIPPDTSVKLSEVTSEMPVPAPLQNEVTFQQLCEEYFDLTAVPRRYTFNVLSQLTDSELEKEKCIEFTTAEGQNDLYAYVNRPRRNIVEVLQDFPNATKNLTLSMLFEVMSPIKPREFSIASSYKVNPNELHILVAVVKYKTKLVNLRLGLCSNYLAELKNGDEISVWLKSGSFKFPEDCDSPVIMVGPGTGVAPFRNYIFDRAQHNSTNPENMILFFGCRKKEMDFHCKDEFSKLVTDGKLTLIPAFSREQEHKIYVQHKITENQDIVWKALQKSNSYIFVAGNSKFMPKEVKDAFVSVCINKGGMTEHEAHNYLNKMEKMNRYQIECWS